MKLSFAPQTRAIRPRWLLEELEVPYELARFDPPGPQGPPPALLALHPLGEPPVLEDGGLTLFESAAICLYLADRFPERRLAPALDAPDRGPYLQWLLFAEVTLEPLVLAHLDLARAPETAAPVPAPLQARLDAVLDALARRLEGRECVAGDSFTAADLVLASILHLAHRLHLLERHPGLVAYVRRHTGRPAARRAVTG